MMLTDSILKCLPELRRYSRALTGSQPAGDNLAAIALESLIAGPDQPNRSADPKIALFGRFHDIWTNSGAVVDIREDGPARRAQLHLSRLTPISRVALLLSSIEGLTLAEIAEILAIGEDEVQGLLTTARLEVQNSVTGRILLIEDEAVIALDLEDIVSEMGHTVTGVARTHESAKQMAERDRPDLILSDIQLADGSSGIQAVNDILKTAGDVPVIFITAFSERLLTGERPEPAFVISKPFSEEQVFSAVSQAMFFADIRMVTL